MAVLEKIRVKFGIVISVVIGLALLSFIIDPSTLEMAMNTMSSKYDVGKIAGKKISYTDFQSEVDNYTLINELLSGSSVQNEEAHSQIRDAAWQALLDKYMFIENAEKAGIKVGDAELVDLISGDNLSPLVAQNQVFMGTDGTFSSEALDSFLQQMNDDQTGRLRMYWDYLQNQVLTQQYYTKYASLFTSSNLANKLMLKGDVEVNNSTASFDYVLVNYPVVGDSTITVSSEEIRSFYNENKKFFKQGASRDIEYVVFEVVPSAEDVAKTSAEFDEAYAEFVNTTAMRTFLLKNSESPYSTYWYKEGELSTLSADLDKEIFTGNGTTGIVRVGDSFLAARVMDTKKLPDQVFVKHILLGGERATEVADSLVNVVNRGGNFNNLVASYSLDQASAADGELGSIGWMSQSAMIPGFESVLEAPLNRAFALNTEYGSHVVLVTEKSELVEKKQVAILEKTALASKETFNTYYAQANNFATIAAGTYEGYRKAVDSTKVYSHAVNVNEATATYGTISNAKEITRWVFDNKVGKASPIITVDNNYFFVAAVTKDFKEGYADVEDVASAISESLYNKKAQDKTEADVKAKLAEVSDLEALAAAFNSYVDHEDAVSLSATNLDPALLGAAQAAQVGEISGPVQGMAGVYVVKVNDKQLGTYYTEEDAKSLQSQKAQYMTQMITPVMMEYDKVKDNRARFF